MFDQPKRIRHLLGALQVAKLRGVDATDEAVQQRAGSVEVEPLHIEQAAVAGGHQHGNASGPGDLANQHLGVRSEEHTSELQSLMRTSYAVLCLKKKNKYKK